MNRTVRDFENAMLTLLETVPFDKMTVDQICQEAMLHRSSFYRYFHDKYDLLEQTFDTELNKLVNDQPNTDAMVGAILDYIDVHRELFHHLATTRDHTSMNSEIMQILSEVLLRHSEQDNNDPVLDEIARSTQPELMSYMVGGAINGAFMWWERHNFDVAKDDVAQFCKQRIRAISHHGHS